jgi:hypothetical protein
MRFLLGRLWLGYAVFRCCCSPAGGGLTPAADTPPVQCLLGRESADIAERRGVSLGNKGNTHGDWRIGMERDYAISARSGKDY